MTHPQPARHERLDALRGAAMVWMALFHLAFDLNHFGLLQPAQNFYTDPLWTTQRTLIVSLFLLCVGMGQAFASQDPGTHRFWRRWAQIALCALVVSVGSVWMFPRSWISFGVLHGIAVMLLVLRFATPRDVRWLLPLGAAALLAPVMLQHAVFDSRWTNWVGLVTAKPVTEDFVPLLPWLGVMWWGLAVGLWLSARRSAWLTGGLAAPLRPLASLGRWPLSFYMLHQPVLIACVLVWRAVVH